MSFTPLICSAFMVLRLISDKIRQLYPPVPLFVYPGSERDFDLRGERVKVVRMSGEEDSSSSSLEVERVRSLDRVH